MFIEKKDKLHNLIDFFITGFIFLLSSITLHEYFHAILGKMFGLKHKVVFSWLSGVTYFPDLSSLCTPYVFLISISGGLITSIIFVLLSYFSIDKETSIVSGLVASVHFFYSIGEMLHHTFNKPMILQSIGVLIGAFVFIIFLFLVGFEGS